MAIRSRLHRVIAGGLLSLAISATFGAPSAHAAEACAAPTASEAEAINLCEASVVCKGVLKLQMACQALVATINAILDGEKTKSLSGGPSPQEQVDAMDSGKRESLYRGCLTRSNGDKEKCKEIYTTTEEREQQKREADAAAQKRADAAEVSAIDKKIRERAQYEAKDMSIKGWLERSCTPDALLSNECGRHREEARRLAENVAAFNASLLRSQPVKPLMVTSPDLGARLDVDADKLGQQKADAGPKLQRRTDADSTRTQGLFGSSLTEASNQKRVAEEQERARQLAERALIDRMARSTPYELLAMGEDYYKYNRPDLGERVLRYLIDTRPNAPEVRAAVQRVVQEQRRQAEQAAETQRQAEREAAQQQAAADAEVERQRQEMRQSMGILTSGVQAYMNARQPVITSTPILDHAPPLKPGVNVVPGTNIQMARIPNSGESDRYYPSDGCLKMVLAPKGITKYCIQNSCGQAREAHWAGGMGTVGAGACRGVDSGGSTQIYASCNPNDGYDRARGMCRR